MCTLWDLICNSCGLGNVAARSYANFIELFDTLLAAALVDTGPAHSSKDEKPRNDHDTELCTCSNWFCDDEEAAMRWEPR